MGKTPSCPQRLPKGDKPGIPPCLACDHPANFTADEQGGAKALVSPYLCAAVTVPQTRAGQTATLRFAICIGTDAQSARDGAARVLTAGAYGGSMPDAAAIHSGMNAAELGAAMELVLPLWRNVLSNAAPQSELWRYGISGDLPVICCDGGAVETEKLLRRFCLLKSCGLDAEAR